MNDLRAFVVIPAYNEERTLRDVVNRARAQGWPVVVVDDGSSDRTGEIAEQSGAVVLRNGENRGKGASLWRGMQYALEHGASAVVTLDGDGQHAPEDIPLLVETAQRAPESLVIAARLLNRGSAPRNRQAANRVADFWISWAAGQRIRDTQSGFRLYPEGLLRDIQLPVGRERGFVFESEILIEAGRRGFPIVSLPTETRYPEDRRPSHFRPVADIARIVRMVAWKLLTRGMYPQGLIRSLRGEGAGTEPGT